VGLGGGNCRAVGGGAFLPADFAYFFNLVHVELHVNV
jgi:hypothetical protein